jgi:hypothetical protein
MGGSPVAGRGRAAGNLGQPPAAALYGAGPAALRCGRWPRARGREATRAGGGARLGLLWGARGRSPGRSRPGQQPAAAPWPCAMAKLRWALAGPAGPERSRCGRAGAVRAFGLGPFQ